MNRISVVSLLVLIVTMVAAPPAASGQSPAGAPEGWQAPRTAWGHPDLQGIWSNTTTTPLQRPTDLADQAFLSAEELAVRDREVASSVSLDNRPRNSTGAYNNFWMERGNLGERTSLIIDPPDGRLPPNTPEEDALQNRGRFSTYSSGQFNSFSDFNTFDRCISRGMPGSMMPGFYNHNYQILQTPDYVVITVEMIHDARIVPLDGRPHLSDGVQQWMGDSRGRWEGDTLVVETTNFTSNVNGRQELGNTQGGGTVFGGDEHLILVERFTRIAEDQIDYEFTVIDPSIWRTPWTASLPMSAIDGPLFEYACHEGNYALENILSGARVEETLARSK